MELPDDPTDPGWRSVVAAWRADYPEHDRAILDYACAALRDAARGTVPS